MEEAGSSALGYIGKLDFPLYHVTSLNWVSSLIAEIKYSQKLFK